MGVMSDATITAMACGQPHPYDNALMCHRQRGHVGEHLSSTGDGNALSWPDLEGQIPSEDLRDPEQEEDDRTERLITGPPPALERVYKDAAALMAILIILLLVTAPAIVIAAYRAALG